MIFYKFALFYKVALCKLGNGQDVIEAKDNERVFFYNSNVEIDFYIPEEETAIQITYDEEQTVTDDFGEIHVLPYWKWCME